MPSGFCINLPFPNPSTDHVTLQFRLPEAQEVRVYAKATPDQQPIHLFRDSLEEGFHSLVLSRFDDFEERSAGADAPPALYRIFVETEGKRSHGDIQFRATRDTVSDPADSTAADGGSRS